MNSNLNHSVSPEDAAAINFLKSYTDLSKLRKSYVKLLLENSFSNNMTLISDDEKDDIYFLWVFLEKINERCN